MLSYSKEATELKFGIYRHYKGMMYEVYAIGNHSETLEELVFYRALYGSYGYWVRPLKMFCEEVDVDGKIRPRFEYLGRSTLLNSDQK